jgi:hypothetical protein
MVYLLAKRQEEKEGREGEDGMHATPYWCVDDLLSHKVNASPAFIRVISDAGNPPPGKRAENRKQPG